ncbi:DUF547 domain-containing protein [bacterium]|jgi:hypothetical protein|nr:DUF547 domain-containing protein [bacterium]
MRVNFLKLKKSILFCLLFTFSIHVSLFAFEFEYEKTWDGLLKTYVSSGIKKDIQTTLIDYDFLRDDIDFRTLILDLESFDISVLETDVQKLSFWVNVYNIAAVNLIIKNEETTSIKDIGWVFQSVWDKPVININDVPYSLNEIENDMLRTMGEPAIHFAIVCASLSCPNLRPEAYTSAIVLSQLEDQSKQFLKNPTKGLIYNISRDQVEISKIFHWFEKDFGGKDGVKDFLSEFITLPTDTYSVTYLPYNWELNSK